MSASRSRITLSSFVVRRQPLLTNHLKYIRYCDIIFMLPQRLQLELIGGGAAMGQNELICYGHYLVRKTEKVLLRARKSGLTDGRKGANNLHARALRDGR
jgi:hypothetical protein